MDDDLVRVAGYPSLEAANAVVRELTIHGLGAVVGGPDETPALPDAAADAPLDATPGGSIVRAEPPSPPEPFSVLVVATDRLRAREILGLADDRDKELASIEKARSSAPPLKILIPVLLAAFVLLPLLAFFISYKASGG